MRNLIEISLHSEFQALCDEVRRCVACARMNGSARVIGGSCGPLSAPIMFIGEAPGRLGADISEIPFHGDQAGHNFEDLIEFAGISRSEIYVTNAVLCNPKDLNGNNSPPKDEEIANCSVFLRRQIDLVNPKVVVTLGGSALKAVNRIEPHELSLRADVRTAHRWNSRMLIPLYHPGQRALIHRSFANQRSDYQFVAETLRRIVSGRKAAGRQSPMVKSVRMLLASILSIGGPVSYFAAHKLLYMVEYNAKQRLGRRLSEAYFIRQKDGPYCTDIHIRRLERSDAGIQVVRKQNEVFLKGVDESLFSDSRDRYFELAQDERAVVEDVVRKYASMSATRLKAAVYMTSPMRKVLQQERKGSNTYNQPVQF